MAKTNTQNSIAAEWDGLTKAQRTQIGNLKRSVLDAAQKYGAVREKLTDLAPKVIAVFNNIVADNPAFQFVTFARMFDSTVPTHAADRDGEIGYRNHRTYYTLSYMRRVVQQAGTQRKGRQGVRDSSVDGLARTIATILSIVKESDAERVWNAIQTELGFGERVMTGLRRRVEETKPIIKLTASKPLAAGNVIHMTPPTPKPDTDAEPLTQPGRNVVLPAPTETRASKTGRKRAA